MVHTSLADRAVTGFHNSGRFDRSDESLERNVHRLRRGRSFGTRTEMSTPSFQDELDWPNDGWGHYHPHTEFGLTNCSLEWDLDDWRKTDAGVLQLTDIRIHTKKGFLLPPSEAPWVVLEHRDLDIELELMVAHMNLHNTALRNAAWLDEADTLQKHWKRSKRKHPKRIRIYQADINRTQRLKANQALVQRTMLQGTGMKNLWLGHMPKTGGTHGRAILDVPFADILGVPQLVPDDMSSDHRPFEIHYRLPKAA